MRLREEKEEAVCDKSLCLPLPPRPPRPGTRRQQTRDSHLAMRSREQSKLRVILMKRRDGIRNCPMAGHLPRTFMHRQFDMCGSTYFSYPCFLHGRGGICINARASGRARARARGSQRLITTIASLKHYSRLNYFIYPAIPPAAYPGDKRKGRNTAIFLLLSLLPADCIKKKDKKRLNGVVN